MSSLDALDYDEEQLAVQEAISRFCQQVDSELYARQSHQSFPQGIWQQLAELGAFAVALPGEDSAGALTLCAICETLGENSFPGPIAATYTAIQCADGDQRRQLVDGLAVASLRPANTDLLPFGVDATVFFAVTGGGVAAAVPVADISRVNTLGGECWGRGELALGALSENSERGLLLGNIADAAYLAGAGMALLDTCSEYVRTRRQFGRTLGEFQAVAHPLADAATDLSAALSLARAAAANYDAVSGDQFSCEGTFEHAVTLAAGARLSASSASMKTAFSCHQAFGAVGVTLEGPVFHISRRIRQIISQGGNGQREKARVLAATTF